MRFFADKRTRRVLVMASILVMSLHTYGWFCLKCLNKPIPNEKPFLMEAAVIPISVTKPRLAPPPPPPVAKEHPQKVRRKHKTQAIAPLDTEPSEFAQIKQLLEAAATTPLEPESVISSDIESETKNAEHLTEVTIDTNYTDNPKPNYPAIAIRQGWQGQVMLRVQVNEAGLSEDVMIERSSGYDLLDESAIDAVKQWHFNPARRGELPITSSVRIPIVFTIDDQASG